MKKHNTTKHSQQNEKNERDEMTAILPAMNEVPRIKLQSWRERLRTAGRQLFAGQNPSSSTPVDRPSLCFI